MASEPWFGVVCLVFPCFCLVKRTTIKAATPQQKLTSFTELQQSVQVGWTSGRRGEKEVHPESTFTERLVLENMCMCALIELNVIVFLCKKSLLLRL
jgi:hypothetical protein